MKPMLYCVTLMMLAHLVLAQAVEKNMMIYGVNLVDTRTGNIQRDRAVIIQGDKILSIGAFDKLKNSVPVGNRIDGKGRYMIPGLWDMHIHLEGEELVEDNKALLPVFLTYGITTVRDCASDLGEQVLAWRNEIKEGTLTGPTLYTAGRKLEGRNSIWKRDLEIENETELAQMLDLLDSYHVDFVKITENTLSGDLFLKSVKAARARGYRVSGHVPIDLTIQELSEAGFTSVEHASYLLRLGSDEASITSDLIAGKINRAQAEAQYATGFNQQNALEGYRSFAKSGMFVCPTLIGGRQLAYLDETDHRNDPALLFLTEKFTSNYPWRIQRMGNETPEQKQVRKARYQFLLKQLPLMHEAGIKIIAGSDAAALNTYVYPAESLIQELEIFQEAGLKPLDILRSATMTGPEYFGLSNSIGTLEPGMIADLVLLDKNPLDDIHALRTVQSVISRGTYYNREALDAMLKNARETKTRLDESRKK